MIKDVDTALVYNWDNKLASAVSGANTISLKYDPAGNRIYKDSSEAGQRKYVVDVDSDLPVILLELDGSGNVQNKYIYANSQILAWHDTSAIYFYLHDRLGSVRQVIDASGDVENYYTYQPFGELFSDESQESVLSPFKYTGQYFDSEFGQYYLRARQYEPYLGIFTANDPVDGKFTEPLSLHKYLYCQNEPINRVDPAGLWYEDIHRSFGNYGWGYDSQRGLSLFDYARLDFDKPAKHWWTFNRKLHFKSKKEASIDLLAAIGEGDIRGFEYSTHAFQDTYTHYDRGFRWGTGHPDDPSVDDLDWSNPDDVAAYRACDQMTRFFEGLFIKSNIDIWMAHPEVDLPSSNPWLSVFDSWSSSSGRASSYLAPIYRQQMGGE